MTESISLSAVLPATPRQIYEAWLDGASHSAFTGAQASVEPVVGGSFTAWDGYIQGKNLELEPHRRIVQSWRTTEFPSNSPDSRLEIVLAATKGGTRLSLLHSEIPKGQGEQYRRGWEEFYLTPMREYFRAQGPASR